MGSAGGRRRDRRRATRSLASREVGGSVRLSRVVAALVSMLVLVALGVGVGTGFFAAAGERTLYATGLWSRGGASTVPPGTFDLSATPAPGLSGLPSPVLPAASAAQVPSAAKVAARIAAVDDQEMGGVFSAEVADLRTGKVLY